MKLALFGANGMAGTCITNEALMRGHELTAVVRDRSRFSLSGDGLTIIEGQVTNPDDVAEIVKGHDAVMSAAGPGNEKASDPALAQSIIDAAHALIEGLNRAGVRRLVVIGGAGSLEVAPGVQLVDTPNFPEQYRPASLAHREALTIYQKSDLDWTFISPAGVFYSGERTGKFRVQADKFLTDEKGESRISAADYAIGFLDEVEKGEFIRRRITIAY